MTELLQQAIAAIEKLSDEQQDAIATRLLDELEIEHASVTVSHSTVQKLETAELKDEQVWQAQFEATTDTQWDCMAAMVRQEITAGDVVPLDLVFQLGRTRQNGDASRSGETGKRTLLSGQSAPDRADRAAN